MPGKSRKSRKMKAGFKPGLYTEYSRPLTQSPYAAGLNQQPSYNPFNWIVATPRPGDYGPYRPDQLVKDGPFPARPTFKAEFWDRRPILKWQGPPMPSWKRPRFNLPRIPRFNLPRMPRFTRRNQQSWPQRPSYDEQQTNMAQLNGMQQPMVAGGKNKSRKIRGGLNMKNGKRVDAYGQPHQEYGEPQQQYGEPQQQYGQQRLGGKNKSRKIRGGYNDNGAIFRKQQKKRREMQKQLEMQQQREMQQQQLGMQQEQPQQQYGQQT